VAPAAVGRSYITRLLLRSRPLTWNVRSMPPTRRSKATRLSVSGEKVTAIGTPPTTSFTTSCAFRIESG
jgi:hypothetical protein